MRKVAKRRSATSIRVDPNVRTQRIYPIEGTTKAVGELQTVGFQNDPRAGGSLGSCAPCRLPGVDEIDVTAYRFERRKTDGTYHITVTSAK